jgi:hypothetical protein
VETGRTKSEVRLRLAFIVILRFLQNEELIKYKENDIVRDKLQVEKKHHLV